MRSSTLARLLIVGRLGLVLSTAFVLASVANWFNYRSYWHGTIRRVQTVDFNLLSHTLPTRLSYLLLNQEKEELQRTLNSNYGFFGIVITDCPIAETDCLNQQVIYKTDSRRDWVQKLGDLQTTQQTLKESPFNILRDPPSLATEGSFKNPREETLEATGNVNQGQIIGRVYYIRGGTPEFWQDYYKWLQKLPTSLLSDSGASKYYALTMGLLSIQGLMAWWFFERILYFKRGQQAKLEEEYQSKLEESSRLEQEYQSRLETFTELLQQKERAFIEQEQYRQEQEQQQQELETAIDVLENQLLKQDRERQERIRQLEELRQTVELERLEQTLTQEQLQQRQQDIDQLSEHLNTTESERGVTQRELEGRQHELAESRRREQQANHRASILEQSITESRQQLRITEERHQNTINQLTILQERNLTLQNERDELQELRRLFEQVNQELTEDNRRLEDQNRQPEQPDQDLEYLRALEEDNLRLSREKRQLEENLQQSITIQNYQEAKVQSLIHYLSTIQKEAIQSNNYVSLLGQNYNTVHELLLEVKEQYKDILRIWEDAQESARALEFKPFEKVYIAFEVLAQTGRNYFNRRAVGESMGADFWKKAFQDRGLSNVYRSGEHEQTMNRYGGARIFTHQGESRQMTQHLTLKLGNAQATPCIQIYFYINRDERIVDIGYCGQHLPIVSSSS